MREDLAGRRPWNLFGVRFPTLILALLVLAILTATEAGGQEPPAPPEAPSYSFEGSCTTTGTIHVLPMGPGRAAFTFYLAGPLVLTIQEHLGRGFGCVVIGFDDGCGLSTGACVWIDEHGDRIFSDLRGESVGSGKHILGTITGGTGRYEGLTGTYDFDWSYVIREPDGTLSGWTERLRGKVVLPASAPTKVQR